MLESRWVRLEPEGGRIRPENGRELAAHDDVWDLLDALGLQLFERTAAVRVAGPRGNREPAAAVGVGR